MDMIPFGDKMITEQEASKLVDMLCTRDKTLSKEMQIKICNLLLGIPMDKMDKVL